MRIGIIGFGRFGKLLTKYLTEDFKVYVFNRSNKEEDIKKANGIPASLEEVCKKDIIIPCVPISEFEGILKKIKGLLKENQLVIDICSVKEYPVEVMKMALPQKVQILATHPLFGPDSANNSLKDRKIVLCKVRLPNEKYEKIKSYLNRKGLIIIETTPKNHDKEIAKSLILTHFIGRGLMELGANEVDIDTQGYRKMMDVLNTVKNDTWKLFEDINNYNKYSKKIRQDFIESLNNINNKLSCNEV